MKDTLILEHKVYISARRAVSISGYTGDYVGQLCREGKLDCKRVGKSWFVTEESLLNYRLSTKQEFSVEEKVKTTLASSTLASTVSDSIILDRQNFVSAKRAAEISGYTSDYVGQLCRLGKLESRRVGTSWFVSEKSLLNHCITLAKESDEKKTEVVKELEIVKGVEVVKEVEFVKEIEIVKPVIATVATPVVEKIIAPKKVVFSNSLTQGNSLTVSIAYFSKLSLLFGILIVLIISVFQHLAVSNISQSNPFVTSSVNSSANVIDSVISFFTAIPKFAISLFSNDSSKTVVKEVEKPPPAFNGISLAPSFGSVSKDEILKERIRESFSDEVEVKPDKSGTAGIITPVFKKTKGDNFVYVLVPVNKNNQ